MVELGVPDALDWDWGTTVPPQHQNGEHLPSHCLALGSWEAPAWTGAFLTTRGEALHPRQVQNPCPAMRTPQDDRNQQGLPHRPAPQAWGGQRGPPAPLGAVPCQQQGCHGSPQGGGGSASVSPTAGDAGRSYFRHCPIWRLPEPQRSGFTAIPTPRCQQLVFKEGQGPDRLLTGHTAPGLQAAPPALSTPSPGQSLLPPLHPPAAAAAPRAPEKQGWSWCAAVSGKNHSLAHPGPGWRWRSLISSGRLEQDHL